MKFIVLHMTRKEAKELHKLLKTKCESVELSDIFYRLDDTLKPKPRFTREAKAIA